MPAEGPDDAETTNRHIEIEHVESLSLDEALSIVGEETRANIVIELGEARTTDPGTSNSLSFSELMKRVGVSDSGRFNYHLDKLVGTFVEKREEGYTLRLPGQLIYQAVVAGTLTDRRMIEPFPVGDCPDCDGHLSAAYHPDHIITVECGSCETLFDAVHFPARGIEGRSRRELLDAAYQRRHAKVGTMRRGVCYSCGAVVARGLQSTASITYGSASVEEMAGLETYAVLACTGCHTSLVGHPANVALTMPTVTGFFADHDRDVGRCNWWDDHIAAARHGTEIVEDDPISVAVPFEIEGDRLRVVLNEELRVVGSDRTTD